MEVNIEASYATYVRYVNVIGLFLA